MDSQHPPLQTLQDIKRMMERSSRFISLSGWSGISAGICALMGAWAAHWRLDNYQPGRGAYLEIQKQIEILSRPEQSLLTDLVLIGAVTFAAALVSAFIFTYVRS